MAIVPPSSPDASPVPTSPPPSDGPVPYGPWQRPGPGGEVPLGAFPTGQDGPVTFYSCRAPYNGGLHCGKALPLGDCNFGWGGAEVTSHDYEVLVGALYYWEAAAPGTGAIPTGAVACGREESGIPQYVCRAVYSGGVHAGKSIAGMNCNIGWGGLEVEVPAFDFLIVGTRPSPSASASDPALVCDARPTSDGCRDAIDR
jgi:hypothetical protein